MRKTSFSDKCSREVYDLKGYVGTDIRFFNNRIYVTSGTGGGLTVLNNQMRELNFMILKMHVLVDVNKYYTRSFGWKSRAPL